MYVHVRCYMYMYAATCTCTQLHVHVGCYWHVLCMCSKWGDSIDSPHSGIWIKIIISIRIWLACISFREPRNYKAHNHVQITIPTCVIMQTHLCCIKFLLCLHRNDYNFQSEKSIAPCHERICLQCVVFRLRPFARSLWIFRNIKWLTLPVISCT